MSFFEFLEEEAKSGSIKGQEAEIWVDVNGVNLVQVDGKIVDIKVFADREVFRTFLTAINKFKIRTAYGDMVVDFRSETITFKGGFDPRRGKRWSDIDVTGLPYYELIKFVAGAIVAIYRYVIEGNPETMDNFKRYFVAYRQRAREIFERDRRREY